MGGSSSRTIVAFKKGFGKGQSDPREAFESRLRSYAMADNRTPQSRSALMSRIGSRNTAPELMVRRLLHRLGYRFRLHRKDLPGTPDIVLPGRKTAMFVHGCFWHAHGCKIGKPPKTRPEFWGPKLARNRERDAANVAALVAQGWNVETVWQCETRDPEALTLRLERSLATSRAKISIDTVADDR